MNDAITVRRELAERYRKRADETHIGATSTRALHRIDLYEELADELEQEAMEIERGTDGEESKNQNENAKP